MVKFTKFPADVAEVVDSTNGAQQALDRLRNGTSDTPPTWFYEKVMKAKGPEAVIGPVVAELKGMKEWPKIASWDLSKLDKFQAQGRSAPFEERLPYFEEYFAHLETPPIVREKAWKKAKKMAVELLRFNETGSPLSIAEVVKRGLDDKRFGTSSGYPLFIKRKNPKAIDRAMRDAENLNAIKVERQPFMVGSRAQMGKVGPEARFIFMAPMAVNICGQQFAAPVQEYLTKLAEKMVRTLSPSEPYYYFFTPWLGWDQVQVVLSNMWPKSNIRFGADYSKMDQHFNKYHALEVFDVIKHYFKRAVWDDLKVTILYPFTAPILTSKGYVDQEHALVSGSEWTNLIETVWNFIQLCYLLMLLHDTQLYAPMGIGDDQLWLIDSTMKPEELLNVVMAVFESAGLPGNPKKQEGIEDTEESGFLQRKMWSDYKGPDGNMEAAGVYPLIRNVTSQVYPERYHNDLEYNWEAFAIRVIMIAENCNTHPLFEWYVKSYIAKANANILRFVRQTDAQVDKKWEAVKNIAGFRPNYNQEKQDRPLREFDAFKLLREVAGVTHQSHTG